MPVSALNVTADSIGVDSVRWSWETGQNVTGMYVDGMRMCGYESTDPSVSVMDLTSCAPHTIEIFTDSVMGNGTNSTMTTCGYSTVGEYKPAVQPQGWWFGLMQWMI